ncbi:MAG: hypothetical protein PHV23_00570 [Candidatus Gracilibacteria bacterium]|nr:hypothetical protein [Candidatus Gracilibacteria bacterium]
MRKKILITSFIITSILFLFISFRFYNNLSNFNEHRSYIKMPINDQKIQEWMTLNYLNKNFGIDLGTILGRKINLLDSKNTLKDYCEKNKLNCDELIILLQKNKDGNK